MSWRDERESPKYDPATFTFGVELEFSDVDKRIPVPEHLGKWEYSERDILNMTGPAAGRAADPLGEDPHYGGEINTRPTRGVFQQVQIINEILKWYPNANSCPTAHTHIHVSVPGLVEDIYGLHDLIRYVDENQACAVKDWGKFKKHPDMDLAAVQYFKLDGGRLMPQYMINNILDKTTDFDSFIRMHQAGKDGVSLGRPFRYAINTYSLKHLGTIEFRMFRGSVNLTNIATCLTACRDFVDAALNGGPGVPYLEVETDNLPAMRWSRKLWDQLQATKHPEGRGKKSREYIHVE